MRHSRKVQRLHELQVVRTIMTETGKLSLVAHKHRSHETGKDGESGHHPYHRPK